MPSVIDINQTLNYLVIMVKGRSARQWFKSGGSFLKQLLKEGDTQ